MVGLAGPWVSGGIEFNWPQHHRPTTFMPLEAAITERKNGEKTVWVGEVDPLLRMKGMAGITIVPGRSYFKAEVQVYNRTPYPSRLCGGPILQWKLTTIIEWFFRRMSNGSTITTAAPFWSGRSPKAFMIRRVRLISATERTFTIWRCAGSLVLSCIQRAERL